MLLLTLATLAIVVQDPVALRAAPRDSAPQQAQLWQGDSLEVRGEKGDFLQVWDHRRERGGYVRASQVRSFELTPAVAPQLQAVMSFVRDTPGEESLGIGYAAAFLKAAAPEAIGPDSFEALGVMADRLARRASVSRGKAGDALTAAHLEVAATYGVGMVSFERNGQVQICYDGEAFRRLIALPQSSSLQRATAALALTRHECVSPDLTPLQRANYDNWRMDVLSRVDLPRLPAHIRNRMVMRKAGVLAAIAYQKTRHGEPALEAGNQALQNLAAVNKSELAEDDAYAYSDAATRVGASRWAAGDANFAASTLKVATRAGEAGETCVQLLDTADRTGKVLFERCTWGIVWAASASANPQHTALALSVQTLETWRELWLFQKGEQGWTLDVLPPAAISPDVGYVEFAGWVPGDKQILTVREARQDGRYKRSFELTSMTSLQVERWADRPDVLSAFYRWQDQGWKRVTVSLR